MKARSRLTAFVVSAVVASAGAVVGVASPAHAAICTNAAIVSLAEGFNSQKLASTHVDWLYQNYAILQATATRIGSWEKYEICGYSGYKTIRSLANGLYVSAQLDWTGKYNGILRASAFSVGAWEKWRINNGAAGSQGLSYIQSVANGKFVSSEIGPDWSAPTQHGVLRARSDVANMWEAFVTYATN